MNIDRSVTLFAGAMVVLSVVLTTYVSHWFVLLALFVGLNLIQSSLTGFCPVAKLFRAMGLKPGCAFQ